MNPLQCLSPARAQQPIDAPIGPAMYGRLFPDLPSFSVEQEMLFALGRVGGLCDCGDEADTPESLSSVAAGWPFFGQFIAHDITADRSAPQAHVDPSQLRNARSPRLNLEGPRPELCATCTGVVDAVGDAGRSADRARSKACVSADGVSCSHAAFAAEPTSVLAGYPRRRKLADASRAAT